MDIALLIFTLLAAVRFFNYHDLVSAPLGKAAFIAGVAACLLAGALQGRSIRHGQYPAMAYAVLMLSLLVSVAMSAMFHDQSILQSVTSTLPYIMAYMMLYAMLRLDISSRAIMRIYLCLCVLSSWVFVVNMFTFPNNMFGEPMLSEDTTRGIVRIVQEYREVFPLMVFYCINRWQDTRRAWWLLLMAYFGLFIVLSVTRQTILLTSVIGTWHLLRRVSWQVRLATVTAMGVAAVLAVTQIPMFRTMVEFTQSQTEENAKKENVRITAWRYYTYGNQTNALTPLLGNGMPSLGISPWGKAFDSETQTNYTFAADVGWAGFYWHFGIFALCALVYIIINALRVRKPPQKRFVDYWLVYLLITSFASGIPVYYYQIANMMVILYMAYHRREGVAEERTSPRAASWMTRLPQFRPNESHN